MAEDDPAETGLVTAETGLVTAETVAVVEDPPVEEVLAAIAAVEPVIVRRNASVATVPIHLN